MWIGELVCGWTGSGATGDKFKLLLAQIIRPDETFQDVTSQPNANLTPEPNACIARFRLYADTVDALEADSRFLVLWCEEEADQEVG